MRQAEVVVYLSTRCFYCIRAKHLLHNKGVSYQSIIVDGDPALWDEMEARSGRSTVPQVFIDQRPIGGFSDLAELDRQGVLDALLFPTSNPGATP